MYTWQITVTRRHGADSAWAESNSAKRCLMTRGALGDKVPMSGLTGLYAGTAPQVSGTWRAVSDFTGMFSLP